MPISYQNQKKNKSIECFQHRREFNPKVSPGSTEQADAVFKYMLEGHDMGGIWANFHLTMHLIGNRAEDRRIKLWKMKRGFPRKLKFGGNLI